MPIVDLGLGFGKKSGESGKMRRQNDERGWRAPDGGTGPTERNGSLFIVQTIESLVGQGKQAGETGSPRHDGWHSCRSADLWGRWIPVVSLRLTTGYSTGWHPSGRMALK